MKITIVADYDAMSQHAADIVTETLTRKPDCALCLPTGNTPLGMFRILIDRIKSGDLDASRAQFFLLDEYVGIDDDDPESLTRWLKADEELKSIPVIAITAFAMKGDEERIREGGCEAYMSKPISVAKFIATVKTYLEADGTRA